jgi:hypothetical protein
MPESARTEFIRNLGVDWAWNFTREAHLKSEPGLTLEEREMWRGLMRMRSRRVEKKGTSGKDIEEDSRSVKRIKTLRIQLGPGRVPSIVKLKVADTRTVRSMNPAATVHHQAVAHLPRPVSLSFNEAKHEDPVDYTAGIEDIDAQSTEVRLYSFIQFLFTNLTHSQSRRSSKDPYLRHRLPGLVPRRWTRCGGAV